MSHLLGLGLLVHLLIFLLPAWGLETQLSLGPWLPTPSPSVPAAQARGS